MIRAAMLLPLLLLCSLHALQTCAVPHQLHPIHSQFNTYHLHSSPFAHVPRALRSSSPHHSRSATLAAQTSQGGSALDGENCTSASDCKARRHCLGDFSIADNTAFPCEPTSTCSCVSFRMCLSAIDCYEGEDCAEFAGGVRFCESIKQLQQTARSPVPSPSGVPQRAVLGFNLDTCFSDAHCIGDRKCLAKDKSLDKRVPCDTQYLFCFCFPADGDTLCELDTDCAQGEKCQYWRRAFRCLTDKVDYEKNWQELGFSIPNTTAQPATKPVPSADSGAAQEEDALTSASSQDGGACIAMHSLQHLPNRQLLYTQPRLARVLCDSNRSCATPGHMVVYKARLMMMSTYCEIHSCSSTIMFVNNPRFRRAMRVTSNTPFLLFTAVAARYESRLEERLLAIAVRSGLL
eukprot:TRINITY_DN78311_c0_g1_i1.p1 TRINITY_DN78311_c0_g1~~TRINITY_DN78311_c0_g1_i1.p1  ORF type:complete len:434 (+),score=42.99 TRINITY_DN78311_c0_g1_i1:90-1304(+)